MSKAPKNLPDIQDDAPPLGAGRLFPNRDFDGRVGMSEEVLFPDDSAAEDEVETEMRRMLGTKLNTI